MIFDETNVSCGDCVHAKVCNKKDSYLELVKDFDNYKNSLNVDGVEAIIRCGDYIKKPTSIIMCNGDIVGYE